MPATRYIIYGAGGVGASLGAQLHQAGCDVVFIARGEHLRAISDRGLEYRTPQGTSRLDIRAVSHPSEIEISDGDIVMLAMKTQDTLNALGELQKMGLEDIPILCAQNGVHNEHLALRRFEKVYGMAVWIPASFGEPGVVLNYAPGAPIELGRIPHGSDKIAREVVDDLNAAGFDAVLRENVLDWKYEKLLINIQTTIDAVCGSRQGLDRICELLKNEAIACYAAAHIQVPPEKEYIERLMTAAHAMGTIDGVARSGGSSSQSLSRGIGSIETDYINGEIVLLGRLYGIPTPANRIVQACANMLARKGVNASPISGEQLLRKIEFASDGP